MLLVENTLSGYLSLDDEQQPKTRNQISNINQFFLPLKISHCHFTLVKFLHNLKDNSIVNQIIQLLMCAL